MDAGIASADNITWLSKRGYPFGSAQDMLYLMVSRERYVQDPRDQDNAVLIRETGQSKVTVYRAIDTETGETRLIVIPIKKPKKNRPSVTLPRLS